MNGGEKENIDWNDINNEKVNSKDTNCVVAHNNEDIKKPGDFFLDTSEVKENINSTEKIENEKDDKIFLNDIKDKEIRKTPSKIQEKIEEENTNLRSPENNTAKDMEENIGVPYNDVSENIERYSVTKSKAASSSPENGYSPNLKSINPDLGEKSLSLEIKEKNDFKQLGHFISEKEIRKILIQDINFSMVSTDEVNKYRECVEKYIISLIETSIEKSKKKKKKTLRAKDIRKTIEEKNIFFLEELLKKDINHSI